MDQPPGGHGPLKKISREEVKHVSTLVRLKLSDHELDEYARDLDAILEYVAALDELDVSDVPPTGHVLEAPNVWQEDVPAPSSESEAILANAPEREERYFKVPKILEG